jgi:uncharacterized membrane protein
MGKVSDWAIPSGLIGLSVIPIIAGAVRLTQMASGAVTAENARFFDSPLPAVFHIIAVTLFSLLGALQFAPRMRGKYPQWHRRSGRVVVPSGLIAALSGLWLAHFYVLPPADGTALYVTRLIVGVWMTYALCKGYLAIRRRDISNHQDWMLRGYAIGMGAGTQVLTHLPVIFLANPPDVALRAVLMGAGWAINAAVAEVVIYRRGRVGVLARA